MHDRFQQAMFALFCLAFVASCIDPPYRQFLLMQHLPTVLAAALLVYVASRFAIGRGSFAAIIAFMVLHTVGARYLYSYTPYDRWSEALLGVSISNVFSFERNHYDRLVHFCYGLLLAVPVKQFEERHVGMSAALASVLAIESVIATSAAYEMIEWLVAATFTPEWADQFLGQQGDPFDAQKDMVLATVGAVLAIGAHAASSARRRSPASISR